MERPMKLLVSRPNLVSHENCFPLFLIRVSSTFYLSDGFDGFKPSGSRFRHPHILELAAYFTEMEKLCLVHPYMSNGTLFDRLQCTVSWG